MNCRRFQNELFEYLDESLSGRAHAAAKRHLDQCDACRQSVLDLQRTAQSLSNRFRQGAESLKLSAKSRQRIMAALEERLEAPAASRFAPGFWRPLAWLGAGAACLLLALFIATELRFARRVRHEETAQSLGGYSGGAISLRISYCDPTYTFRTDGNLVIDSLSCQPRIVEESLHLARSPTRQEPDRKSPL